jgi:hypothetical protein
MLSKQDEKKGIFPMKDCICIEFTVPRGKEQTIFTTEGIEGLFASGFISYDCGHAKYITVRFYDGHNQVGNGIQVFHDSSIGFTQASFNRISVTSPSSLTRSTDSDDIECLNTSEGEICLNIRISY